MPLITVHPDAERLARELATKTGETLPEAVLQSIRERLVRNTGRLDGPELIKEMRRIGQESCRLPVLDHRSPEEILGYDDDGLPR